MNIFCETNINFFRNSYRKDWRYFFEEKYTERAMKMTSESIAIHVWNKHSSVQSIPVGSQAAYRLLAAKYCPKVYEASGEYF